MYFLDTFRVKFRGIHQIMLEEAHITDKLITVQKLPDYGSCYTVHIILIVCQIDDFSTG